MRSNRSVRSLLRLLGSWLFDIEITSVGNLPNVLLFTFPFDMMRGQVQIRLNVALFYKIR